MENIRKIMEIMDDDEMFPTRNEWAYVKISNELKKLHFKIKELSHSPTPQHLPVLFEMHGETYALCVSDHDVRAFPILRM
jgi:hypothetical protein